MVKVSKVSPEKHLHEYMYSTLVANVPHRCMRDIQKGRSIDGAFHHFANSCWLQGTDEVRLVRDKKSALRSIHCKNKNKISNSASSKAIGTVHDFFNGHVDDDDPLEGRPVIPRMPDDLYETMLEELDTQQKHIFEGIRIHATTAHSYHQLKTLISGPAGSGKSTNLDAIAQVQMLLTKLLHAFIQCSLIHFRCLYELRGSPKCLFVRLPVLRHLRVRIL